MYGITGAGVPAKRAPGEWEASCSWGRGYTTRVNTSRPTVRRRHSTRDLGAKPQPNTPPAK